MAIKILSHETIGTQSIAEVEVTYPGESPHVTWEFYCEDCDDMFGGLTEKEARLELDTHTCKPY